MSFGLNQYLTLGMAGITSKQISFSPGGRIIHICSRLRNPESPLRATCSLLAHMLSKWLKYHHGAHFQMRKLRDLIKVTQLSMLNARTNLGSVQFSRSVMSNSLRHRESQHARAPGPSPTPRVHSNSCPSSQLMPSNDLILCHPLLLLPPIPPIIRVFSSESALCMRWPKYWSFNFTISPSNEHPLLISFRMD